MTIYKVRIVKKHEWEIEVDLPDTADTDEIVAQAERCMEAMEATSTYSWWEIHQ